MKKVFSIIGCTLICAGLLVLGVRAFLCDRFVVPSNSMAPTLLPGDRILVNKTLFGPRVYKRYDFGKDIPLSSVRIKGKRSIKPGDIVVYNAPYGYDRNIIEFKINHVYCKRCIGGPGDTIGVRDAFFYNNRYDGIIGQKRAQEHLSATHDSLVNERLLYVFPLFKLKPEWTIFNYGPIYVPAAGDCVQMTEENVYLYRKPVLYETGKELTVGDNGVAMLADSIITSFTFSNNYYYFCGDNVIDSIDSRYQGFVPEDFIVGIVDMIEYSLSPDNKRRIGRTLKKL